MTSEFDEVDEFVAALRSEGVAGQLTTGQGRFRARLTQVALHHLNLTAGEEQLSRVTFVEVPTTAVLVSLAIDDGPSPIWGGAALRKNEIITMGPGERLHARTIGPCCWHTVRVPLEDVLLYGRVLNGYSLAAPLGIAQWRPSGRELHSLHRAAIRTATARPAALTDPDAARGLDQQLLHALIECLAAGPERQETPTACRHRAIVAGFERLLAADPFVALADISRTLGVAQRSLRDYCREHLGMAPNVYRWRLAMQAVHLALRHDRSEAPTVADTLRRYGFHDPGRFAGRYRAVYGESPSTTLRNRS